MLNNIHQNIHVEMFNQNIKMCELVESDEQVLNDP